MSRYVARRRVELGLATREVSIPSDPSGPGQAEVDFGEFYSTIAGVVVKCWMFVMRLSYSGKAFHVAFATQAQEAFLEGSCARPSLISGACPAGIRYENVPRNIFTLMCPPSLCAGPAVVPSRTLVPLWFDDSCGRRWGA